MQCRNVHIWLTRILFLLELSRELVREFGLPSAMDLIVCSDLDQEVHVEALDQKVVKEI